MFSRAAILIYSYILSKAFRAREYFFFSGVYLDEVKGKDQLLTATNTWALSQSIKKKVDLEVERY